MNKAFEYKSFWNNGVVYPINICNTIAQLDNNSFELELLYHIFEDKLESNNMVNYIQNPKIQEKTKETKQTIKKEEKNLKQNNFYIEFNFTRSEETEPVLQKFLSDLKIDKKWNLENIFFKRKFVCNRTSNYICILFDNDTDSIISIKDSIHYHIYGEGKDKKFDHYFVANANSVIRDSINDSQKRVLLFAHENENKISLFDEIKCESCSVVPESENKRNVIIFKFRSLLRNKEIDATPLEEAEKDDSTYQNYEIENVEIDKPSNHTNMSKLQELYETQEKFLSLGIAPNADLEKQLAALEEESIQNEIVPIITQTIEPVLKSVKRKIVLVVDYDPEEGVYVHLSQKKSAHETTTINKPTNLMEKNIETIKAYKKLRVTFPDGTTICERAVADTLALTIQKFGTERVAQLCESSINSCLKPAGVNLVTKKVALNIKMYYVRQKTVG